VNGLGRQKQKDAQLLIKKEGRLILLIRPLFGSPAIHYRGPVALRPWVTPSLPFTEEVCARAL
jgi:hypothetical protein